MENDKDILYEKAKFYKTDELKVHITLTNGNWLRGLIVEVKEDRIILIEEKFSKMLVLFEEIKTIVPRQIKPDKVLGKVIDGAEVHDKEVEDGRD